MVLLIILVMLSLVAIWACFMAAKSGRENTLVAICAVSFLAGMISLGLLLGKSGIGVGEPLLRDHLKDATLYMVTPATNVMWIQPAVVNQITGEITVTNTPYLYQDVRSATNNGPVVAVETKKGIILKSFPLKQTDE